MSSDITFPAQRRCFALWSTAVLLGGCETAITYDAMVGLNWSLLILGSSLVVFICSLRSSAPGSEQPWTALALTTLVAAALLMTTDPFWQFLLAAASATTLSVQILMLLGVRTERIGAACLASAPFRSAKGICQESARRLEEVFAVFRAQTGLRIIRAIVLALPVALVLALLLSGADPTFAAWRDAIARTFTQISILGRIAWFGVLSVVAVGAMGLALQPQPVSPADTPLESPRARFSQTDQLAVLGSAATVFALYLALQVSYLFGNSAAIPGSHVTYAEAVHRGFIELNAATTLSALVIITLLMYSAAKPLPRLPKAVALVLVLESQILAVSALHRIELYETAYGYTEQRLLVGVYAGAVIVVLAMLGWEIMGSSNFLRLARRTWVLGILTLCGLVLWNHEAWIVRANLTRYRLTHQLDTAYLLYDLGPDGLSELGRSLPSLDIPMRAKLENCLAIAGAIRYGASSKYQWYEWTRRRALLRDTLERYRVRPGGSGQIPGRTGCDPG